MAPQIFHSTVDDVAETMQAGGRFRVSCMTPPIAFISKSDIGQGAELVRRTAGLTRPITRLKSSEKTLPAAVNSDTAEVADKCVSLAQQ